MSMNDKSIEIRDIVYAPLVRRVFAFIIDIIFFALLFLATFLPATEGLFDYGFNTMGVLNETMRLQVKSGLFIDRSVNQDATSVTNISSLELTNENGYFTFEGYETYIKAIYYFYFLSDFSNEVTSFYFDTTPTLIEKNKWFNENVLLIGWDKDFDVFYYENNDIYSSPVNLNEDNQILSLNAKVKNDIIFNGISYHRNGDNLENNQEYIVNVLKIFTDTDNLNGTYHIACNNLARTSSYSSLYKSLERISRYEAYISIAIGAIVYFLIIPLFFKNGETLGMKMTGIGLVNTLGYQIAKKQVFAKYLFISIEIYIGFFTMFLFYLVDYLLIVFTKKHRSISDYISASLMIDTKNSVWFLDKKTEDMLTKQVTENLRGAGVLDRKEL